MMSNPGNARCRKLKLLHYIFFIFFIFPLSLQSSPDDDDAACLLRFRASLHDASVLRNWFPGANACLFYGVYCNASRVISVDLSFLPLNSDIKSVTHNLLSLKLLQKLSLSSTNLTGALSSVLPRCSDSLKELDLSNNSLSGSVSGISVFSTCGGLKSLNLSRNGLVSRVEGSDNLAVNLQSLDLSFNRISGTVSFSDCRDLDYLDISSNNFSTEIPSFIDCSYLRHIDLSDNKFFGAVVNHLSNLTHLEFLNLSCNAFNGSIPAISRGLKFLYLTNNGFDGGLLENVLDCGLVELDVSFNKLSGKIPHTLQSCSSLSYLNIANNRFSGELEDLIMMSDLKKLVVSYNYITGSLPESLSELTMLEILDASSNNFSGSIPNLCRNSSNSLKELYLQNNLFSGKIPASLSNCSMMSSLDLSFNFLTGSIPSSFGSLSNIRDLMIWMNKLRGEIPTEIGDLKLLENLILDFNDLTGEIPSSLANCINLNWISLSNNKLTGQIPPWIGNLKSLAILELGNNSIHGEIPAEIGNCSSLIWLDLNTNSLTGPIPPDLFKQSGKIAVGLITGKRYAYIKNDGSSKACHGAGNLVEFSGIRQEQLSRASSRSPCNFTRVYGGNTQATFSLNGSIIFFDLSYNSINGELPKETGSMFYVQVLNLGHNNLSGEIPDELGNLARANIIDLSYNELNGSIPPSMTKLSMLAELDLSNNRLQGIIPQSSQFESFPAERYGNNSGLCGYPLPLCARSSGVELNPHRRKGPASLAGSVAMGLLFSIFCIFAISVVAVEVRKRKKKEAVDIYVDPRSQSVTFNGNWKFTGGVEALSTNLAIFDKPLRKLTFGDLMEATNGFHNETLIGSGGFGDVYKAQLKDGTLVAIKKLIHVSGQGEREFTAEMETIGKIKHRNLVPLLGYCKVGEERLLVYEFMKYGSLEDVLHDRKKKGVKLNWSARRRIAIGAARGLAFLHHNCVPHIIHRDMKSSNVLLDENLEARVSDFGMARLMSAMETHLSVSTLAGTPGYVPPEYYQSFRCSTRGDVYSYGVVLLELLSGRPPTDSADFGDNNLVGWVKQHAKTRISDVFDPYLMNDDPAMEMELLQHLKVACACLDDRHWRRPTMIQVMAMFKEIQAGAGMDSASTIVADDGVPAGQQMTIIKEGN